MTTSHIDMDVVALAAQRLAAATVNGRAVPPVRDILGTGDIALAYAVQRELTRSRIVSGAKVIGRKIGLTSAAVQQQLGVDQPDFGVLFDDMDMSRQPVVPTGPLMQPKVEAEIAFILGRDLADGELGHDQVCDAVDYAVAALEIVDSRIANWDITITDTVADNASSGMFVLGDTPLPRAAFTPRNVRMQLYRNDELVSEGIGADCLGDPLIALHWLANTARDYGDPLLAGQVVLSGALGPMVSVGPGDRIRADISPLGVVNAVFAEGAGQ